MSNSIDQIEIKFKDGSPLWVYIQELVPLTLPDGSVASYMPNRIPIEPNDPRVQGYIGAAAADAIAQAQKQTQIAADAISSRDATLARCENLEEQLAQARVQLESAQSMNAGLRAQLAAHSVE